MLARSFPPGLAAISFAILLGCAAGSETGTTSEGTSGPAASGASGSQAASGAGGSAESGGSGGETSATATSGNGGAGQGGAPGVGGARSSTGAGGNPSGSGGNGAGSGGAEDAGLPPPPDAGPPQSGVVYGHSDTTLFKMNPVTKEVSIVGNFDCVSITVPGSGEGMWDIAIDKLGKMVGTTMSLFFGGALVEIDEKTGHCVQIAKAAQFPNSLTFVPAGTLDPAKEVLVGFNGAQYVRIDPQTGQQTVIGNLNPNPTGKDWESSGDVVSIIDDKTYLTVKPLGSGQFQGTDHIVEIDVLTGQVQKVIGDTTFPKLWGLGYWAGTAYGFSAAGQLCSIDLTTGLGTAIPLANVPLGLAWWGAGVTTAAPHK